ncbi:HET-domain-containing protein, partial [Zopfia rhizophila CBS 207.26]
RVYCERADLELIRAWINICWHAHGKSCEEPGITSRLLGRIRVIDIQTRTVVDAPPGCRYAALTYVWGDRPQFQARKEHFQRDAFGRKCMPLPQRLPQTITDAFFIVHSIGLRYLWVDSLCIIQNSHEDRHDQILRMDAIYSSAVVTIAAASGAHSDTGISGVSLARAFHQVSEIIQGFRLAIPLPSYADLDRDDNLIWNTRGWTFQEKVLSRRLLMFTNHQVYFRC